MNKKLSLDLKEKSLTYFSQKQSPNYSNFKDPDFKDIKGRLYKIAYDDNNNIVKTGLGSIKCFVKIPKNSQWFTQQEMLKSNITFILDNEEKINLKLESCFRIKNSKTGYLFLNGTDLNKLFYYFVNIEIIFNEFK